MPQIDSLCVRQGPFPPRSNDPDDSPGPENAVISKAGGLHGALGLYEMTINGLTRFLDQSEAQSIASLQAEGDTAGTVSDERESGSLLAMRREIPGAFHHALFPQLPNPDHSAETGRAPALHFPPLEVSHSALSRGALAPSSGDGEAAKPSKPFQPTESLGRVSVATTSGHEMSYKVKVERSLDVIDLNRLQVSLTSSYELKPPQLRLFLGELTDGSRIDQRTGIKGKISVLSGEVGYRQTFASGPLKPLEEQHIGYIRLGIGEHFLAEYANDNLGRRHQDQGETQWAKLTVHKLDLPITANWSLTGMGLTSALGTGIPNREATVAVHGKEYYSDVRFPISRGQLSASVTLGNKSKDINLTLEAGSDSSLWQHLTQDLIAHDPREIPRFFKTPHAEPYFSVSFEKHIDVLDGSTR